MAREATASPTPGMAASASQPGKGHPSPSKASSIRTYDSKLVSREMHRLGNLAHLPALSPSLSNAPSTASVNMVSSSASSTLNASGESPWNSLNVEVLPLFNGERLRIAIEDLNALVKRHIQGAVSLSPSKALATLEYDASELIAAGMVTLNAKLAGVEDEKLVSRVVEVWGFFWDQVLPYVEGALLPLQTDPLLSSLYRVPKTHKATSPATPNGKGSMSSMMLHATPQIDVRTLALHSFRDSIILPAFPRLYARLTMPREEMIGESPIVQMPRLQQMLLVLVSQHPSRPISFSLTSSTPQLTPGENAVQHLLRAVRAPLIDHTHHTRHSTRTGTPSFLSAGLPRDRRGRIAQKHDRHGSAGQLRIIPGAPSEADRGVFDEDGGETPRMAAGMPDPREREKEFLESLRSPDPEDAHAGMGSWAHVFGPEETNLVEEVGGDEKLGLEQLQATVERMVGMKSSDTPITQDSRRRI
ncbi:HbrB-domain-containing protein [Obba rivulosa]|uniref:HbrB-domain-containing protein n=1 Tax=Obba rivulosa TaxID=1052685 RepID=A0A8E2DKA3_9APHY|nr:HbrB-domain-containing protein [Obba rivulosa]